MERPPTAIFVPDSNRLSTGTAHRLLSLAQSPLFSL
jgi:hypothetical protein